MTSVPGYTDIGRAAADLLVGSSVGKFQYDNTVAFKGKSKDGLAFALNATLTQTGVEGVINALVPVADRFLAGVALKNDGKVEATLSAADLAPGLGLSVSGLVADINSAKLAIKYAPAFALLNVAANVTLTNAPIINAAATTGYKGFIFGADTSFDSARNAVTKYDLGVGYAGSTYSGALKITDALQTLKALYHQDIDATSSIAVEVSQALQNSKDTAFTFGYAQKMAGGALVKAKIDHTGIVSLLWEHKLSNNTKVGLSGQINALKPEIGHKTGLAFEVSA